MFDKSSVLLDAKTMAKAARQTDSNPTRRASGRLVSKESAGRIAAVFAAAEVSGLLREKTSRIGGRVSPRLIKKAKSSTGIESDTDLIEFALASVALDDAFADAFRKVRGSVDPDIELGFWLAEFDVRRALRWARFDPRSQLSRRPDSDLPFLGTVASAGSPLLLDTGVYVHQMQGRAPTAVEDLITLRQSNHSTVAIQELMHTVGALDPADLRTPSVISSIESLILAMPDHRIFAPDADVLGRAAILSGMLSRLQGYAKDARHKAHQDCVLFLQAQKLGLTVLTANVTEFDYLLQLIPSGRVLFYRQ